VTLSHGCNQSDSMTNSAKLFSIDKEFIIGFVGNTSLRFKGFKTLFKALVYLVKKYNLKFCLCIAGSSVGIQNGNKNIRVINYGFLKKNEMKNFYENLDVYICPSLTEGLPRALIEAMSFGIPCIGTNIGGIPELLENSNLFPPRDYIKLANRLYYLLSNIQSRVYESGRNLKVAVDYDSILLEERRIKFYNKIYHDILSK
jgi:glycosyltransferase involved in cell wall biosynthesis